MGKTTKILLRRIEPGEVKLGDTKPVTLKKPFYIGVFEITQKQYSLASGAWVISWGSAEASLGFTLSTTRAGMLLIRLRQQEKTLSKGSFVPNFVFTGRSHS